MSELVEIGFLIFLVNPHFCGFLHEAPVTGEKDYGYAPYKFFYMIYSSSWRRKILLHGGEIAGYGEKKRIIYIVYPVEAAGRWRRELQR
ncbi:MAG: hypothetical protein ACOYJU_07045 [Anaerovoracaceae bacterium]|jgi:hypothetical protein